MVHICLLSSSGILNILLNFSLHQFLTCKMGIMASMSENVMWIKWLTYVNT